jgi:hypothetical protein
MTSTSGNALDNSSIVRRAACRVSTERAPSWTGRAATSSATERAGTPPATAGMHRTRVSEMRDGAGRAARRFVLEAIAGTGRLSTLRSGYSRRSRPSG